VGPVAVPCKELQVQSVIDRQHSSNSFVVRIWWEQDPQPLWRGWVQHAGSGARQYFDCLTDLLMFIESHTGSLAQAPNSPPEEEAMV